MIKNLKIEFRDFVKKTVHTDVRMDNIDNQIMNHHQKFAKCTLNHHTNQIVEMVIKFQ